MLNFFMINKLKYNNGSFDIYKKNLGFLDITSARKTNVIFLFYFIISPWPFRSRVMIETYWHCATEMNMPRIKTLRLCPIDTWSISILMELYWDRPPVYDRNISFTVL